MNLAPCVCLSRSQMDHYSPVTYTLPDASDTQFNMVKSLFLGKVFGKLCANFLSLQLRS